MFNMCEVCVYLLSIPTLGDGGHWVRMAFVLKLENLTVIYHIQNKQKGKLKFLIKTFRTLSQNVSGFADQMKFFHLKEA